MIFQNNKLSIVAAVFAAMFIASCVPIQEGETSTDGAGDSPAFREMAKQLSLPRDASASDVATNRIECSKLAGNYGQQGLLGSYMCTLSYSDAGKSCTAESDCLGQCIASNDGGPPSSPGKCQPNTSPFGCYASIDDDGNVGGMLCRD